MNEVFQNRAKVPVFSPCENAGDGITGVGFCRKVFDIAVIAGQNEGALPMVEIFEQPTEQTVESFERFNGNCHVSSVAGIVRQPVFEERERVPCRDAP